MVEPRESGRVETGTYGSDVERRIRSDILGWIWYSEEKEKVYLLVVASLVSGER